MNLDEIRSEFIAAQATIQPTVAADGTIALGRDCDTHRLLELSNLVGGGWAEETPYDLLLLRLAACTGALLGIDPTSAMVDAWRQARAEHADAMGQL